jgi:uncharacterized membrane protein
MPKPSDRRPSLRLTARGGSRCPDRLGQVPVATGDGVDARDSGRVSPRHPSRSFTEHLALGVGLIRRYGAAEPTVTAALLRLLTTALEASSPTAEHRAAITEQADLLVSAAQREIAEPADLALVHSERVALDHALETRTPARRD